MRVQRLDLVGGRVPHLKDAGRRGGLGLGLGLGIGSRLTHIYIHIDQKIGAWALQKIFGPEIFSSS